MQKFYGGSLMLCPSFISKNIFYPVWDIWDKSKKLQVLKSLEKSQWKESVELELYQWQRFKDILNYAYLNSPYYKKLFDNKGLTPDSFRTRADLPLLPITRKLDVRNNLDDFLSIRFDKSALIQAKTGGSTGFSLELYFDKACQEHRNAAALRSDRWAGWNLGMVRGELWGNPPRAGSLKEKIRHELLDRVFYLDTMQINGDSIASFLNVCSQHNIEVIFGHAHSIYIYAKYIHEQRLSVAPLKGIIATSMMLLSHERELIEKVFACKVTNRYGCEEVGLI
ncbi:MAG: phenylacetate--CoA ligase family protein, partial [Gammaproteobacteria bacterium]|nr:phenylacetate--CoA ligase family protein [Gammaproteobacteria bacterium]